MGLAAALSKVGIINAGDTEVTHWLTTGDPILDQRISGKYVGGGFPCGKVVEVAGEESTGKTLVATHALKDAQRQGGVGVFQDHEKSFNIKFAKNFGLSDDPDIWVYNKPLTYEQSWEQVKQALYTCRGITVDDKGKMTHGTPLVAMDKPICVVFDSLPFMTPQEKYAKSSEDYNMRDKLALSAVAAATLDTIVNVADLTNTLIIFINQVKIDPTIMMGDKKKTTGGKTKDYAYSVRVMLDRKQIYDQAKGIVTGQRVNARVIKNKVYRPFGKASWDYKFDINGMGHYDTYGAVIDELIALDIIKKSGSWLEIDGIKKQGKDKLIEALQETKSFEEVLDWLPKGVSELPPELESVEED